MKPRVILPCAFLRSAVVPHRWIFSCAIWTVVSFASPAIAQRDLTDIPEPDPVAEMAAMKLSAGAQPNLFAADPVIRKPIQMNFDHTGQLWVASSEAYPQIRPGEIANDKIVVLSDSDRDGTLDSHRVFADGLLIPTGVIPDGPDACYVAASTELLYFQDTDGDGVSDRKRIVFSGFGTEDTHHLLHTLRWGPDGCLYFNQSIYIHSHIDTALGTKRLDAGGIWRFRPSTGELQVLCKGFINPWGHVFDAHGESFVTDGAFFEGINYAFPDSVFTASPGAVRWLSGLNPGSPKHCGLEVLSGKHIPDDWSGDLLTNDFRSHRVCRFTIRPNASGYLSRQQPELLTSSHVAFRPVDVRMGPDGAIYVADWYNPIIQHGEVDFRDERRDREHGRIWRVSFPDRAPDLWPDFDSLSFMELLDQLEAPSLAVRQFARQRLWERGADLTVQDRVLLDQWRTSKDATDSAQRMLEYLWLLEAWQNEKLVVPSAEALAVANGLTERPIIRSLWRLGQLGSSHDDQPQPGQDESSPRITQTIPENAAALLEVIVCDGQQSDAESADHLVRILTSRLSEIREQPNLDFAMWQSLRATQSQWLRGDGDNANTTEIWSQHPDALAYAIEAVARPEAVQMGVRLSQTSSGLHQISDALRDAMFRHANADQLGRLLEQTLQIEPRNDQTVVLRKMVDALEQRKVVPSNAENLLSTALKDESTVANDTWWKVVSDAAASWKLVTLESNLLRRFQESSAEAKAALIPSIGRFRSKAAREMMNEVIRNVDDPQQIVALRAVAQSRPDAALDPLTQLLTRGNVNSEVDSIVLNLTKRKGFSNKLADRLQASIESSEKKPNAAEAPSLLPDVARRLVRRVQSSAGNEKLINVFRRLGSLEDASWKLTPPWSSKILTAAKSKGDPNRGQAIYRRKELQCINCHAIGEGGGLVGPNLISLGGSSQPDYILESLIEPNAKLKEGYTTKKILTLDAELITGIEIGATSESIRLRLADGKEVNIDKEEIEIEEVGQSLMPKGLLDGITEGELIDLVAFLSVLGRDPNFTVSTTPMVRTLETLNYTSTANRRLNRTSTDTVAKDDPAMTWRPQTTLVDGQIPLSELDRFQQHRQTPPTSFLRFELDLPSEGVLGLNMPTEGIESWVDGMPTPTWNLRDASFPPGRHVVVLGIDRSKVVNDFTIQLTGDASPIR